MTGSHEVWARCNACKEPIHEGATYWVCNVSTCNQKRTGLRFCSVSCWEVHLPDARHREAWAVEKIAQDPPPKAKAASGPARSGEGKRRIVRPAGSSPAPSAESPREILIVASRLKEYVRSQSGFNTSDKALGPLSDIVRRVCDEAIRHARSEGRRTVLDRDVPDSD